MPDKLEEIVQLYARTGNITADELAYLLARLRAAEVLLNIMPIGALADQADLLVVWQQAKEAQHGA